jgi:hypothetical protein
VVGPDTPTPVSPNGTIAETTPTYTWQESARATQYKVKVYDSASHELVNSGWLGTGSLCSGGICQYTSSTALVAGDYSWQVRAQNTAGFGDWSDTTSFTVVGPDVPTPVAPSGATTETTPTCTWQESSTATQYKLKIYNSASQTVIDSGWFNASPRCSGGTCQYTPSTALVTGDYSWHVRAQNAAGYSDWSGSMAFTVQ